MNNRKAAREAVAGLIVTLIPPLEAAYDHNPLDSQGLSPYATVTSDGTATGPGLTLGADHRQQALFITLYWRRAPDSADGLDNLSEDVIDLIEANKQSPGVWDSLQLDGTFSQVGETPPEDGVVYDVERIRVIIW